jgi:hypothetical protein
MPPLPQKLRQELSGEMIAGGIATKFLLMSRMGYARYQPQKVLLLNFQRLYGKS